MILRPTHFPVHQLIDPFTVHSFNKYLLVATIQSWASLSVKLEDFTKGLEGDPEGQSIFAP